MYQGALSRHTPASTGVVICRHSPSHARAGRWARVGDPTVALGWTRVGSHVDVTGGRGRGEGRGRHGLRWAGLGWVGLGCDRLGSPDHQYPQSKRAT